MITLKMRICIQRLHDSEASCLPTGDPGGLHLRSLDSLVPKSRMSTYFFTDIIPTITNQYFCTGKLDFSIIVIDSSSQTTPMSREESDQESNVIGKQTDDIIGDDSAPTDQTNSIHLSPDQNQTRHSKTADALDNENDLTHEAVRGPYIPEAVQAVPKHLNRRLSRSFNQDVDHSTVEGEGYVDVESVERSDELRGEIKKLTGEQPTSKTNHVMLDQDIPCASTEHINTHSDQIIGETIKGGSTTESKGSGYLSATEILIEEEPASKKRDKNSGAVKQSHVSNDASEEKQERGKVDVDDATLKGDDTITIEFHSEQTGNNNKGRDSALSVYQAIGHECDYFEANTSAGSVVPQGNPTHPPNHSSYHAYQSYHRGYSTQFTPYQAPQSPYPSQQSPYLSQQLPYPSQHPMPMYLSRPPYHTMQVGPASDDPAHQEWWSKYYEHYYKLTAYNLAPGMAPPPPPNPWALPTLPALISQHTREATSQKSDIHKRKKPMIEDDGNSGGSTMSNEQVAGRDILEGDHSDRFIHKSVSEIHQHDQRPYGSDEEDQSDGKTIGDAVHSLTHLREC